MRIPPIPALPFVLPLVAALAACAGGAPVPVYLKPGTEAGLALRQEAECRAQARRSVPERRRIDVSPSIGVGIGSGGRVRGGLVLATGLGREAFDHDANEGLRGQAFGACMGGQGYRLVTLPACRGAARPLESHPFDTTGLCVAQGMVAAPAR